MDGVGLEVWEKSSPSSGVGQGGTVPAKGAGERLLFLDRVLCILLVLIVVAQTAASFDGLVVGALLISGGLLGAVYSTCERRARGFRLLLFILLVSVFAVAFLLARHASTPRDPEGLRALGLETKAVIPLEGRVSEEPGRPREGELRFAAMISGGRVRVLLGAADVPWATTSRIRTGSTFRTSAKLDPVFLAGTIPNPFSYEAYLARRGFAASGRMLEVESVAGGVSTRRERFLNSLTNADDVAPRPGLAVLLASTIGESGLLDSETRRIFQETGLTHVLVVSGYQVGVVFALAQSFLMRLFRRSERLLLLVPAEIPAVGVAFVAATLYATIIGGVLTTVRAVFALGILAYGRTLGRSPHALRALGIAFCAMGLIFPGAMFEAGCELTFMALLGLLVADNLSHGSGRLRRLAAFAVFPCVLTTPVLLAWFGQLVPLAPLYNLLFAPLFCVVGTCLGGLALLASWLSVPGGETLVGVLTTALDRIVGVLDWSAAVAAQTVVGYREVAGSEQAGLLVVSVLGASAALYFGLFRDVDSRACASPADMPDSESAVAL